MANTALFDSLFTSLKTEQEVEKQIAILGEINIVLNRTNPHEAIANAKLVYQFVNESNNPKLKVEALCSMGIGYRKINQPELAHLQYQRALDLLDSIHFDAGKSSIYKELGNLYHAYDAYEKSDFFYKKGVTEGLKYDNYNVVMACLNNLGENFRKRGLNDSARAYLKDAVDLQSKVTDTYRLAIIKMNYAHINHVLGDDTAFFKYAKEAIDLYKSIHAGASLAEYYFDIAEIANKNGFTAEGISKLEFCLDYARGSNHYEVWGKTLDILIKYKMSNGEFKAASEYLLEKNNIINQELMEKAKAKIVTDELDIYIDHISDQVESLESEKQAQAKELWLTNLMFFGVCVILVVIMYLAYVLFQKNNEKKLYNQKLTRQMQQIDAQNELQKKLYKEKDQLISLISHDLKTPLTQSISLADIILEETDIDEIRQLTSMIKDGCLSGIKLINRLLAQKRAEELADTINHEKIEIISFFEKLRKQFETAASQKNIAFELKNKLPHDFFIESDVTLLHAIFQNLISNAIKFSPEATKVTIILGHNNNKLVAEIIDSGPGFTERDKERMFAKYQQLSAKPTAGEDSTGIGLYVVKTYLDKLEGVIKHDNLLEGGSRFTITI